MDSFDFVDRVKAEKANALARYRRFTNIAKFFQLIEVFVAVAVISWSSTRLPSILKVSGEYVTAFSSYLMNQHVVFLVANVIGLVCYLLSRHTEAGNDSGGSGSYYDDGKYDRLSHLKTSVDAPIDKPAPSPAPVIESPISTVNPETESQNRMIQNETAILKKESEVKAVTAIKQAAKQIERVQNETAIVKKESEVKTETAIKQAAKQIERFQNKTAIVKKESKVNTVTAIKQAANQIENFQRTQSDKKIQNSMKPCRELRRSVTAVTDRSRRSIADTVDKLSNEEFQIAIEAFISRNSSFSSNRVW